MGSLLCSKSNPNQKQDPLIINQLPLSSISYNLLFEIEYKDDCSALAFNKQGTLLATACKSDIKIWKVDVGKLIDQNIILKGHSNQVRCLVFSNKQNWLISGGNDQQILCWKEHEQDNSSNNWICSQPFKMHRNYVYNLILNQNEDELISCGADHSIKVWKANASENSIQFLYSLDQHQHYVYQISLNSSETQLVSCSMDTDIIIWERKDENQHWKFSTKIEKSIKDHGHRVGFLADSLIAWTQYEKGDLHIFKQQDGKFIQMPQMKISLKSQNTQDIYIMFPLIFNTQKKVMIVRHNRYVSLFELGSNEQFSIIGEPIDCQTGDNYGTLSRDGKYLVIWNDVTKQLKVYQIQYP
ncbi:unnamed protein product (macronuclear) [Paramecium tetraurelia]|uniref:Uncharacterized protein n=1 Tax=Paramecium tetraurelia TaxID=5888 RepID=A0DHE8_PARTE|nr:uncharacterized protein GSPATT00016852001 [Paramecium tetraurelia]CAK82465.1 unnamed protein product [Paramecium tetraurelia]|eukprot:XP_001449862.1 hypothetical protein (macronuclear) [Paramecium tetraurelia strain d4-2]